MTASTPRKLAAILHADVIGSTALVQRDESVAHERMQDAFRRFSATIEPYGGIALEIRGDALFAEFARASDAVSAALAFRSANTAHKKDLADDIRPYIGIDIILGEVVVADGTLAGTGVVLAQRLGQLAEGRTMRLSQGAGLAFRGVRPNQIEIFCAIDGAVPTH